MMAPKPPKIRPRPQKTADHPGTHPIKMGSADATIRPETVFYQPKPQTTEVVLKKKAEQAGARGGQASGKHNSTRHGSGRGKRSLEREFRSTRKPSAMSNRKFVPLEGSLTGAEKTPVLKKDTLYYVPLGGLEEVGRNCMFFEYNDEIVVVDMGIQFPEEETPGVDWIIPNTNYLEKKKKNIKALIITHAHYDHFGAVPYVLEKLGNPPVYATPLIREVLKRRLEEMPNVPKMNFTPVKNHDRFRLSEHFTVEFFNVSHTVPDTTGILLETPTTKVAHFADFRLDYLEDEKTFNLKEYEWLASKGVDTLLIDSTNAWEEGHSISEKVVIQNLEKLLLEAEGRIILSTFASMITRLAEVVQIAERIGRKVIINGRSMKENLEIAKRLGYFKYKEDTLVPVEELGRYPDDKVLILSTGAMGQENAGLMRIVSGEHKHIRVKPGDTVIFSASVIPGAERGVQILKDNFARQGAIVHTNQDLDIHSSGHAPGPDLALVAKTCQAKFVIPVHGYYFMRAANTQHLKKVGIGKERVIMMDNGQVAELHKDAVQVTKMTIDSYYVMVDGLGVGDVEAVVLRDRKLLAQEGMVVIINTIARKTGRLLKNPDVISRGFIYLKDHTALIDELRTKIRNIINQAGAGKQEMDPDYLKGMIRDQIGLYLYNKTQRRPMILPVVIEV